jgi:hypothetical protein
MLDALLDGCPLPGGDPDGLQPVADVLAALRAPAAPAELAGQASALAAFRAQPRYSARAARSPRSAARAGQPGRARRRGPLLRPRLAMAFAAGAAVLAGLALGAHAGDLPGPVEQLAHTLGMTTSRSTVPHRHHHPKLTSSPAVTPSHPYRHAAVTHRPFPFSSQHSHRPASQDGHQHDGQQGTGPGWPGGQGGSPTPSARATPSPSARATPSPSARTTPTPSTSPAAQPSPQPSTSPHQHSSPSSPP